MWPRFIIPHFLQIFLNAFPFPMSRSTSEVAMRLYSARTEAPVRPVPSSLATRFQPDRAYREAARPATADGAVIAGTMLIKCARSSAVQAIATLAPPWHLFVRRGAEWAASSGGVSGAMHRRAPTRRLVRCMLAASSSSSSLAHVARLAPTVLCARGNQLWCRRAPSEAGGPPADRLRGVFLKRRAPLKTHPSHLLSAAQKNSPLLAWKPSPLGSSHVPRAYLAG